jgi:hypothetical protein
VIFQVSFFSRVANLVPCGDVNFEDIMSDISSGRWKEEIQICKNILRDEGKPKYKEYRSKNVPHFASHAVLNTRDRVVDSARCKFWTGLLQLDFDNLSGDDLSRVKSLSLKDPSVVSSYISPSGSGVKIHLHVPQASDRDEFRVIVSSAERYCQDVYGVQPDLLTLRDMVRLCSVSFDPDLYYNKNSIPISIDFRCFF